DYGARTVQGYQSTTRYRRRIDHLVAVEDEGAVVLHQPHEGNNSRTRRRVPGVVDLEYPVLDHDEIKSIVVVGQREFSRSRLHQDGGIPVVLRGRENGTADRKIIVPVEHESPVADAGTGDRAFRPPIANLQRAIVDVRPSVHIPIDDPCTFAGLDQAS